MADDDLKEDALHPDIVRSDAVDEVDVLVDSIVVPGQDDDDEGESDPEDIPEQVINEEGIDIPEGGDEQ